MQIEHMTAARHDRFIHETGLAAELAGLVEPVLEEPRLPPRARRDFGPRRQDRADHGRASRRLDDHRRLRGDFEADLAAARRARSVGESYRLEVSSPGIDRPLVRPSDFERLGRATRPRSSSRSRSTAASAFAARLEGFEDGEMRIARRSRRSGRPEGYRASPSGSLPRPGWC